MYYLISFTYNQVVHYCIWVSSGEDYVLSDENGIVFFYSIEMLMKYAFKRELVIEKTTIAEYNVDNIKKWCNDLHNSNIDCVEVLNFWNICSDFANGMRIGFLGDDEEYNEIYEQILYGNNLFTDNYEKRYVPRFSKEEMEIIKRVLLDGVRIITENIAQV